MKQINLKISLFHWVKHELIPKHIKEGKISKEPSSYNRAYYPTNEDLRYLAQQAILEQRDHMQDQNAIAALLQQPASDSKFSYYFRKYEVADNFSDTNTKGWVYNKQSINSLQCISQYTSLLGGMPSSLRNYSNTCTYKQNTLYNSWSWQFSISFTFYLDRTNSGNVKGMTNSLSNQGRPWFKLWIAMGHTCALQTLYTYMYLYYRYWTSFTHWVCSKQLTEVSSNRWWFRSSQTEDE